MTSPLARDLLIVNKRGLHARASAKFVNFVAKLPESISVVVHKDGNEANGGSILSQGTQMSAEGNAVLLATMHDLPEPKREPEPDIGDRRIRFVRRRAIRDDLEAAE